MMFLSKWIDERHRSKPGVMEAEAHEYDIEVSLNKGLASGYAHWLQPILRSDTLLEGIDVPLNSEASTSERTDALAQPPASDSLASSAENATAALSGSSAANSTSTSTNTNTNDLVAMDVDDEVVNSSTDAAPAPQRRGRGRPRVNRVRDGSAIEKRRAQVRNAQRTYQKKKDQVSSTTNQRCDQLLEVLSDLSTDIEELLQAAVKSGLIGQNDEMAAKVQKLWSSYDSAINKPIVSPELRLLQVKNHRRQAGFKSMEQFRIRGAEDEPGWHPITPSPTAACPNNPPAVDLEVVREVETTMIQPFNYSVTHYKSLAGKNIFDLIKERQARFHLNNADEATFAGTETSTGTVEDEN